MNPRCPPAAGVLLLAALVTLGCRDEPTFPTDPTSPPQASLATTAALAWGYNLSGQLGSGQAINGSSTPVPVAGNRDVGQLRAGYWHTCAKMTISAGYCWGDNFTGALGTGTNEYTAPSAVPVPIGPPR